MRTVSSVLMLPSSIASSTSSIVMTFVTDAGGSAASAFFSNRTVPVEASMRIADFASMSENTGLSSLAVTFGERVGSRQKRHKKIQQNRFCIRASPLLCGFAVFYAIVSKQIP